MRANIRSIPIAAVVDIHFIFSVCRASMQGYLTRDCGEYGAADHKIPDMHSKFLFFLT